MPQLISVSLTPELTVNFPVLVSVIVGASNVAALDAFKSIVAQVISASATAVINILFAEFKTISLVSVEMVIVPAILVADILIASSTVISV